MRQKLLDLVDFRVTEAKFIDLFCNRLITEQGYSHDNFVLEMGFGTSLRADLVIADSRDARTPIAIIEFQRLPERNTPDFLRRMSRYSNICPAARLFSIFYSTRELRIQEHFVDGGQLKSRSLVEFPSFEQLSQTSKASTDAGKIWSGPFALEKNDLLRLVVQAKRKLDELSINVTGEGGAFAASHASVADDLRSKLDLNFSDLGVPEPWKTDDDLFSAVLLFSEELDATISGVTANESLYSRTLTSVLQELQAGLRKILTSDIVKQLPGVVTWGSGKSSPIDEQSNAAIDILVITAMLEPEFTEVLSVIEDQTHEKPYSTADYSHRIRGRLADTSASVLVATQDDMGMANAGILATKLILRYRPKYVVMTGIAAGIDSKTQQVGDILVPSHTYDLAMGKLEEDEDMSFIFKPKFYQKDARDHFSHVGDILGSARDTDFQNALLSVLRAALPDACKKLLKRGIQVHHGSFGSGGTVIAAEEEAQFYRKINGGLIGFDMEAHAVVTAAAECGLENKPYVLVAKAICDFAGTDKKKNKDLKQRLAARASAIYFHHFFVNYVFADD